MKRFITRLLAIGAFSSLTAILLLALLLLTSTGNRWLWQIASSQLPPLQGELEGGSLLKGWQFRSLAWHPSDADTDLTIDIQNLSLSISAERLLQGELLVETLAIGRINVVNHSPGDSSEQADHTRLHIPSFTMPLPVDIKQLSINELEYGQAETSLRLDNLQLSARAEQQNVEIRQLAVSHEYGSLQVQGRVSLLAPYPLRAQISFSPDEVLDEKLSVHGMTLPDTGVSLSGHLTDYRIELQSEENQKSSKQLSFDSVLSGNLEELKVQSLNLHWLQQQVNVNGLLGWRDGVNWQGSITFTDLNPGNWLVDYPGLLSGTLVTGASVNGSHWQAEAEQLKVSGTLRTFPVLLRGQVNANSDLTISTRQLELSVGSNRLKVNGDIGENWNLSGVLHAPQLNELYAPLGGDLSGDFELTGNRQSPHVAYQLNAGQVAIDIEAADAGSAQSVAISGLKSQGLLKSLSATDNKAHLQMDSLRFNKQVLQAIDLTLTGNPDTHELLLTTEGETLTSDLQLDGSLVNEQWQGRVNVLKTESVLGQWNLKEAVKLQATRNEFRNEPFCLISQPATFCLGKGHVEQQQINVDFALKQLDVARFPALLPKPLEWQSVLSASGNVLVKDGHPDIRVNVQTSEGMLTVDELQGEYNKLELNGELVGDQVSGQLEFESPQLGTATVNVQVTDIRQTRLLKGQLVIDQLLLEMFQPFIPDTRNLSGEARANLTMDGSVHDPLLNGEVIIEGVSVDSEFCDVSRINSRMLIQGKSAVVSGQLEVGVGASDINGTMSWKDGQFSGLLHLTGSDLQCTITGIGSIWASPDLHFNLGDSPELSGIVTIPKARIEIKSLPEQAISISDDVEIVGRAPASEPSGRSPLALNTTVQLGDDVRILAYGLSSKLAGSLALTQSGEQPLTGQGSVELVEGRYRYLGQDLLIKKGQIIFQGPLNSPFLNLEAIRNPDVTQDEVVVGVNVSGSIKAPQWSVFSTPTMPQQEQFSYLLRGRGIQTDGEGMESILLGMGLGGISQTATKLGDQLGIKDFSVDTTGSGENTQVAVGGYIAPGLRLQYGTGVFNSVSEVKIRYEVIPRVYLQAVSGLGQALDVFYRFDL